MRTIVHDDTTHSASQTTQNPTLVATGGAHLEGVGRAGALGYNGHDAAEGLDARGGADVEQVRVARAEPARELAVHNTHEEAECVVRCTQRTPLATNGKIGYSSSKR